MTRRRVALTVAGLALVISVTPGLTEATWADSEHGSSVTMTALTIPAPFFDTCTASSVLVSLSLTPRVVVTWHYPSGMYDGTNARYYNSDSGILGLTPISLGSGVTTTGPVSGTYTSTFQGNLLSGLLGGSADVGISTTHSSGWTSLISSGHATFPLLVGAGTCTITNN
ncbi:hypothetical protein GY21_04475 [Cryobacterium roopkundense]|uniref:Ig-like domain-containing protein n=1 Tax=Cryobacterium roopkundense TaxID=1001240 RepID=A0A099JQI9_9MICO|nr:hypothetical protein [Cryobacterium roopkundense]KGJ79683.1 hypothetical protein GY21_04475 [Cryobacterium roopkundense]MBB5642530.1 hypothetical protein [Cryobacterium roopkundense]